MMSLSSAIVLVSLLVSVSLASSTFVNGTVYYDCNSNGVYDRNELPFSNAKIILSDSATGKNISTTISTPTGAFSFTVAQKEVYNVCAALPSSNFFFTVPAAGCLSVTVQTDSVSGLLIGVNEKLEIFVPPSVTVSCGSSTDPAQTGTAATKSCPGSAPPLVWSDSVTIPCQGAKDITRTWTVSSGGQTASAVQYIYVIDNMPPVIVVPHNAKVECGQSTSPSATGTATATDNCSTPTMTFTDSVPRGNCPQVFDRRWTATDSCGNTATSVQTITISDVTGPDIISFPPDVTVPYGSNTYPSATGTPVATDNCGPVTLTFSDATSPTPQGTTIYRTWTASDTCGTRVTRVQKIYVLNPPSF